MPLKLNSSGGGSVTLDTPTTALAYTVTLPTSTSTLATTNGTLTNPTINGFTGDTSVINIGSNQIYKDTAGNVGIGTIPNVKLTVNGVVNSGTAGTSTIGYTFGGQETKTGMGCPADGTLAFYAGTSTERARIDSAGRFTTPFQPRFSGYRTGGAWISAANPTILVANNTFVNTGNCYNTSTGVFTCPVAGTYRIAGGALVGNTGYVFLSFFKNGVVNANLSHGNANTYPVWFTIGYEALVSCAANDTLSVTYQTSGTAFYDTFYNYVIIELVG
jgi:hypothetical protein